jgi:NAD(P)-dependent dehydrogenase (short-subunit alcohol dehydrogenase family)
MHTLTFRALDALYGALVVPSFGAPGYRLRARRWRADALPDALAGRRYVVTGANAGLGLALARGLARRGGEVAMVCRNRGRGEAAAAQVLEAANQARSGGAAWLVLADLSSMAQARDAAAQVAARWPTLDALINNAGVMLHQREVTAEGLERTFATNVLSGCLLTGALRGCLARAARRGDGSGRVVHVTSGGMYTQRLDVGDLLWERKPYDGVVAYAQTKRAQVILNRRWSQALASDGVTSNAMHPGWAATPGVSQSLPRFAQVMGRWLRDADQGADTALWLATSPEAQGEQGGLFLDRARRAEHVLPHTRSTQADEQALWARCASWLDALAPGWAATPEADSAQSPDPSDPSDPTHPTHRARP